MDVTSLSLHELLTACLDRNNCEAWQEFIDRFRDMISRVVYRKALSCGFPEMANDLVQDVFVRICEYDRRVLRKFLAGGEDKFFGLLRVIALNTVSDRARKNFAGKRGQGERPVSLSEIGVTAAPRVEEENLHNKLELERIDKLLLTSTSPHAKRERQIFWLRYRDALTVKAIAETPYIDMTPNQVDAVLTRLKRLLGIDKARGAAEGNE